MKKWLDDLYAILMKRGFITLDNVLKKYKTEIEDYEEIKINDEPVIINPNETYTVDLSDYFLIYDRYVVFNRGNTNDYNFTYYFYKYNDVNSYLYSTIHNFSNKYTLNLENRRFFTIKNISDSSINFNLYIKKIF